MTARCVAVDWRAHTHTHTHKQAASGAALGGPDRVAAVTSKTWWEESGGSEVLGVSSRAPLKIVIGCNKLAGKFQCAQGWMTD